MCVDKLHFNPDGTIQLVKPTLRGVGITDARSKIEIDRYSSIKGNVHIEYLDTTNYFEGWKTVFERGAGTIIYKDVEFGKQTVGEVALRVKATSDALAKIYASAKLIATVKIGKSEDWMTLREQVKNAPAGVKDLKMEVLSKGTIEIDWVAFDDTH